jgi:hypothetical protein
MPRKFPMADGKVQGGFAMVMNPSVFDERFAQGSSLRVYVAGMSTELPVVDGAYLARRLRLSEKTVQTELRRLIDWGYVIRAEMREGQRKSYGYLFLGVNMEVEAGRVDPEDDWARQCYADARRHFPRAVALSPVDPFVTTSDQSATDVSRKVSSGRPLPEEEVGTSTSEGAGHKGRTEGSSTPSLRSGVSSPRESANAPQTPPHPARKTRTTAPARRYPMTEVFLDYFTAQVQQVADGRLVPRGAQREALAAWLETGEVARYLLSDLRDAFDFAVHGTDELARVECTGSARAVIGWLENALQAVKIVEHASLAALELDRVCYRARRLPSHDEVPRRIAHTLRMVS